MPTTTRPETEAKTANTIISFPRGGFTVKHEDGIGSHSSSYQAPGPAPKTARARGELIPTAGHLSLYTGPLLTLQI